MLKGAYQMRGLQTFIILFAALASSRIFSSTEWPEVDVSASHLTPEYGLMLLGALVVMLVQAGFAIIEGQSDAKPRAAIKFLINYIAAFFGNIAFFLCSSFILIDTVQSQFAANFYFQTWYWNILIFYMLMSTTLTMVVARIIPRNIGLLHYAWIALFISTVVFGCMSYWVWGGFQPQTGLLKQLGFIDFAGATVVHSMAAWMVLAGYWVLGRQQRKVKGETILMSDYKLLSIAVAAFILWLAWSGVNIAAVVNYKVDIQMLVANSVLALMASGLSALCVLLYTSQKVNFETMVRAAVGGLVAITASCALVSMPMALVIGALSGLIVMYFSKLLQRWIDAPNVIDVLVIHGLCGVWGTLALVFSQHPSLLQSGSATVVAQLAGVVVGFIWSFTLGFVLFKLIRFLSLRQLHHHDEREQENLKITALR